MNGSIASNSLSSEFGSSALIKPAKKKRTPPVSIRFSDTELAILTKRAGNERLSSFIRRRAMGGGNYARKVVNKVPIKDHTALARVLSALGRSELQSALHAIVELSEDGLLVLDQRVQNALLVACADIADIRLDLVMALGLRSKVDP